jgi:uncharacterized protein
VPAAEPVTSLASFTVTDNPAVSRYELYDGDPLAGTASYRVHGNTVTFIHTPRCPMRTRGQGAGSWLAREALDGARRRGPRMVARCPFIADWIRGHPEYADLLN